MTNSTQPHSPALLYRTDLMRIFRKSESTIKRWVKDGVLPKPARIGGMHCWPTNRIHAWAQNHGIGDLFQKIE